MQVHLPLCCLIPDLALDLVSTFLKFIQLSLCLYRLSPMIFVPLYLCIFIMRFTAVRNKATHSSASCSLVEGDKHKQASFFYYHLIFYLHYPAFLPLCYFVWSCSEYFACFLVYAPDTRTKKESHLTWMEIWIRFSLSPSSPFSPPLLSVPSLLNELQIKALRSLSSVQDTSTVVRKVLREHKNSSSEHWLCICWVYTWCVCFVYRNHRKQ